MNTFDERTEVRRITRGAIALAGALVTATLLAGCDLYIGWTGETPCRGRECGTTPRDRVPPGAPTNLSAYAPTRQSIYVDWVAPADDDGGAVASYELRYDTAPIDEASFETAPGATTWAPRAPGAWDGGVVDAVRPGETYYVAVRAVDEAGNRSAMISLGPIVPELAPGGARGAPRPDDGDNALGYRIAGGDFDGDGFADVAVAAPFKRVGELAGAGAVYVFLGGADGLAAAPDVVIEGTEVRAQLGNGLTAIDWDGDGVDDLAAGAPFSSELDGAVYVFAGGPGFAAAPLTRDVDAAVVLRGGDGDAWFDGAGFGWTLARARFDRDGRDDLLVGVPAAAGGDGGLAVVYGGTAAGDVVLGGAGPINGAKVRVFDDPAGGAGDLFGHTVVALGATEGSGDPTDDVAIGYFQADAVIVLRGRVQPASPGVHELAYDHAADLTVRGGGHAGAYFGAALGSIADVDGDGGRDLVIGAYRDGDDEGAVYVVSAAGHGERDVGAAAIVAIRGAPGQRLGSAVACGGGAAGAGDVDGDGVEDLLVVGGHGAVDLYVWFGDELPRGEASSASAPYTVAAPWAMAAEIPSIGGTPMTAAWTGDVDGDGLADLAWADWTASERDGAFEILR